MKKELYIMVIIWFVLGLCLLSERASAQKAFPMEQAVELAQTNAWSVMSSKVDVEIAETDLNLYKAAIRPSLNLSGSLPNYFRTSTAITQPNGTVQFQRIAQNNLQLSLFSTQEIPMTGGQIFVQSDLTRFDDFTFDSRLYNGVPLRIGIIQPLFSTRPLYWEGRLAPLRTKREQKGYEVTVEAAKVQSVDLYFEVLIANENKAIATLNEEVNQQLLIIAEERLELGKISRDEKLQLEIELKSAQLDRRIAENSLEIAIQNLAAFLNTSLDGVELFESQQAFSPFEISEEEALQYMQIFRPEILSFQLDQLSADQVIQRAKIENGPQVDVFASFGLARGSENISDIYSAPFTEQQVGVQVNLPILDWGTRRNTIKRAKLLKDQMGYNYNQQLQDLENQVRQTVLQFNTQQQALIEQKRILDMTEARYEIANDRYVLGAIDITNLTLAQREKNAARRNYVLSLRQYWISYYSLRFLTGYDFSTRNIIEYQ